MTTKAQSLYQTVSTNKRSQNQLKFPQDLDTDGTGNIIRFSINLPSGSKYISNGEYKAAIDPNTGEAKTSTFRSQNNRSNIARRFSDNYVRTTTNIDLYMPPSIQSSYQSDWSGEELGMAGSALDAGVGLSNIMDWQGGEDSWDVMMTTLKEAGLRTLSSTASALSPVNFEGLRKASTSTIANPYMEVLFNGAQNRTFSFTFKMIPRNQAEQQAIKGIVDEFKFHRAPEMKYENQNNYMLFPSEFDIKFLNRQGENPWLFKISTCAMTNFTVNYSPEGQYASFSDGSPFATEITLEFMEMEILDKGRIKEGY